MSNKDYIIVETNYGNCRIRTDHFKNNISPTIQTAVNKSEYFINQANEVHSKLYSYINAKYINSHTKVNITCNIHGNFDQRPNCHLSGKGCPKCANYKNGLVKKNSNEYFLEKSRIIHLDKYSYDKSIYNIQSDTIIVTCKKHGDFNIVAKDHLRGKGCKLCGIDSISSARSKDPTGWTLTNWIKASEAADNFDSFKIYIIRCFNNGEEFIKIGRTFNKTSWRFRNVNLMPYQYEVIREIVGSAEFIFNKENELKRMLSEHKYLPLIKFHGMHECFNTDILENINTLTSIGK